MNFVFACLHTFLPPRLHVHASMPTHSPASMPTYPCLHANISMPPCLHTVLPPRLHTSMPPRLHIHASTPTYPCLHAYTHSCLHTYTSMPPRLHACTFLSSWYIFYQTSPILEWCFPHPRCLRRPHLLPPIYCPSLSTLRVSTSYVYNFHSELHPSASLSHSTPINCAARSEVSDTTSTLSSTRRYTQPPRLSGYRPRIAFATYTCCLAAARRCWSIA